MSRRAPDPEPRVVKADNRGPFTLDGTRTFLVGTATVAVVDPGPDSEPHVRELLSRLHSAREVRVLLTHTHGDHAAAAQTLARHLGAPVLGPASGAGDPDSVREPDSRLVDGARVPTDQGDLVAVETPGHTRDHMAFHWPRARALFAGDLVLGRGSTTWVGEYVDSVGDYLRSLRRVRALNLAVIYPTHGRPLRDPLEALKRFEAHRLERVAEVREALRGRPTARATELVEPIYGKGLSPAQAKAAASSIEAMLYYLQEEDIL